MHNIPGKTKVGIELFKGVTLADLIVGTVGFSLLILVIMSNLPLKLVFAVIAIMITVLLLVRIDDEPLYYTALHMLRHYSLHRRFARVVNDEELQEMNERGADEVSFEKLFEEEKQEHIETKEERKARIKQEKAERKADDKLLKSKKLSKEEEDAIWLKRANQSAAKKAKAKETKEKEAEISDIHEIMGFREIKDGFVTYSRGYYGAFLEIPPIALRFFSASRRKNAIEKSFGSVLRSIREDLAANIIKIERPVRYDSYIELEQERLDALRTSYEHGVLKEDEFKARTEIIFDRIEELQYMSADGKVILPFYYVGLYDSDKTQLTNRLNQAIDDLKNGEMLPHRLNDKELAVFLKYTNTLDFDEREIDNIAPEDYVDWACPKRVTITPRTVQIDGVVTYNFRMFKMPNWVGDAWLAGLMTIPATKVVVKSQPMDRNKAIRQLDISLQELRGQYQQTNVDSKLIEIQQHINSLEELLATLSTDNEVLLATNIYVTAYDIAASRKIESLNAPEDSALVATENFKRVLRHSYMEDGYRLNNLEFCQMDGFLGSQATALDPYKKDARGIPSNSVAAIFPWIYSYIQDEKGIKYGRADGVPVFIDFFKRDNERINSNMVIVGKSGSGKSYATKSILANLAADDAKIFILDPENEYTELAGNLHGKFINVGNAQFGRLNPFHIISALDDDEDNTETVSGSYATHLQFLEEFFRQILPDCEKDALEYLNSLIDRMYTNMGITAETNLKTLRPTDYPTFDHLYDAVLQEFQQTDNAYIRTMLRTLMNYLSKFATGGRNANIWNGPSTITTEENFTVFNFQSLLANRNGNVANAQMLLVLKYIDNEIIKNRDYNTRNHCNRKVVVVIDEAHVFIDTKFPIALDFMFQLAKRIRKYNGMQIVITQNIKDFVGSEEIARKSTAIINACQYSLIFPLAPNDMHDLCTLYEKAGGINEHEQEEIIGAHRGHAFTIMSPQSRSTFKVTVPQDTVDLFQEADYESRYFSGTDGQQVWDDFLGESREIHDAVMERRKGILVENEEETEQRKSRINFVELTEEDIAREERDAAFSKASSNLHFEETTEDDGFTIDLDDEDLDAKLDAIYNKPESLPTATPEEMVSNASVYTPSYIPVNRFAEGTNSQQLESIITEMHGMVESISKLSYDSIMAQVAAMVEKKETSHVTTSLFDDDQDTDYVGAVESTNRTENNDFEDVDEMDDIFAEIFGQSSTDETKDDSLSVTDTESSSDDDNEEEVSLGSIFDLTPEEYKQYGGTDYEESSSNDEDADEEIHFDFKNLIEDTLENMDSKTCMEEMEEENLMTMNISLVQLQQYLHSKELK